MALSTWRPLECQAVARELEAWCAAAAAAGGSPIATPEDALRMRASLQRAQRVVEAHTAALIEGYGGAPSALGAAFGLPPHMGATFVDSVIRAGVPFQLSRLLTPMLRAAARAAGSTSGYDAIVLGTAVGRLLDCDRQGRNFSTSPSCYFTPFVPETTRVVIPPACLKDAQVLPKQVARPWVGAGGGAGGRGGGRRRGGAGAGRACRTLGARHVIKLIWTLVS